MRDEEQGGHRWERVRGKHSRRCAPATGGVPMPKMRCIDRKVRAESRSSEQTNLGSSTCHGLPCGFAVITNRNPHSRRTGGILGGPLLCDLLSASCVFLCVAVRVAGGGVARVRSEALAPASVPFVCVKE